MAHCTRVFQISGIKNLDNKRDLVQGIQQLGGRYIGSSVYRSACTHLITPQVLSSEKFLAACAAGKWVLTPDYVLDSVKNGSWLAEGPYEISISTSTMSSFYPVRQWREKVSSGRLTGAFQGWRVLLKVQEPTRLAMFKRLLRAGRAIVYYSPPPSDASITHVMAKPMTEEIQFHDVPCYPVSHIVQHLFGCNYSHFYNITDDLPVEKKKPSFVDFSKLKTDLKNYVMEQECQPRLFFLEFLGYHDPYLPQSQATEADFYNVRSMIEGELFPEALDTIRNAIFPGLLPPATYLVSLIDYAQQGNPTSFFVRNLQQVMNSLLVTNPPWLNPSRVKKYFAQVLQCPRCKTGMWPFLETAISYCLSSETTCHPLPGPALPTLLQFHSDILRFCLKLFQAELHNVTTRDFFLPVGTGVSQYSASGLLMYETFWTIWERSTLLSRAVKQLLQHSIVAAKEEHAKGERTQKLYLLDTLLNLLSVLVEFWCQQHLKLNQSLVKRGLQDLSEHFAMITQGVSPMVLADLVGRICLTRLKLVMADSIFRNLCSRNGLIIEDNPLSLTKMVISYLPALGCLAQSPVTSPIGTEPTSTSCSSQGTSCSIQTALVKETDPEKENVPRGLNRVNAAGETLLHRACKRNQVETVLQILAHPGTDVNVKDYAGWTPLHEACNHGSTACVEALLRHRPSLVLNNQVGGVSPLHDAVLNGHMDIAKMLLQKAGSVLLQQTDRNGRTALDLVSTMNQREELLNSAQVGDSALRNKGTEVSNLALLEAGSYLLVLLLASYQREHALPGWVQPCDKPHSLSYRLVQALEEHSLQRATLGWCDQRAVRLVEDTEMLLELGRGHHLGQVSTAVKECKGENTQLLMVLLEELKSRGEALVSDL